MAGYLLYYTPIPPGQLGPDGAGAAVVLDMARRGPAARSTRGSRDIKRNPFITTGKTKFGKNKRTRLVPCTVYGRNSKRNEVLTRSKQSTMKLLAHRGNGALTRGSDQ